MESKTQEEPKEQAKEEGQQEQMATGKSSIG